MDTSSLKTSISCERSLDSDAGKSYGLVMALGKRFVDRKMILAPEFEMPNVLEPLRWLQGGKLSSGKLNERISRSWSECEASRVLPERDELTGAYQGIGAFPAASPRRSPDRKCFLALRHLDRQLKHVRRILHDVQERKGCVRVS
ncbi:hypothetical protein SELMODRAFT_406357 [Selaginella moellendorffii]|uniref:Uncharacterized protein n=1 Tax=Selaginella moellendorffii TaxID=88036 RepID=D8R241_SELML|nr:hypothetical protein SELMODRAFT_406357 [Selaginella moellendorffii]